MPKSKLPEENNSEKKDKKDRRTYRKITRSKSEINDIVEQQEKRIKNQNQQYII